MRDTKIILTWLDFIHLKIQAFICFNRKTISTKKKLAVVINFENQTTVKTTQEKNLKQTNKQTNKKHNNLQFMFLTNLWPSNNVKVIKPRMTMSPLSKNITMQSLKDLPLVVTKKKPTFFSNDKNVCNYLQSPNIYNYM